LFPDDGGEKGEEEERPEPLAGPSSRSLPDLGRCSEGIEALTEYLPVTDPFTRKILKNPFVNKFCGHVYEYQSALDMIITSNCRTRYVSSSPSSPFVVPSFYCN